jgi:hypothetical protein
MLLCFKQNLLFFTQASVHHKAHTASSQVSTTTVAVHHKALTASKGKISVHQVAVHPQAHGIPLLNAMKSATYLHFFAVLYLNIYYIEISLANYA